MTETNRCPQCGAPDLSEAGAGLRHCPRCGATLAYRTQWLPVIGVAVALSMLLGLASALLLRGRAALLIGPVAMLAIGIAAPRFRRLQKV